MKSLKIGTVALVIRTSDPQQNPMLIDQLSDDHEIELLEEAIRAGERDPLNYVYTMRQRAAREDEDFGNYVEDLLSQPFVRSEIQEHGLQWLRSKLRIEQYQKCENDATQVIAQYAFRLFQENPERTDFILAGPVAKVRVRVFKLSAEAENAPSSRSAA